MFYANLLGGLGLPNWGGGLTDLISLSLSLFLGKGELPQKCWAKSFTLIECKENKQIKKFIGRCKLKNVTSKVNPL